TAMVRGLVEEEYKSVGLDAGRFLSELNREVLAILGQTDTMMMLSAFYLVADLGAGAMRYASAGHPTPLHVRRGLGVAAPLPLADRMPGPPLGVRDNVTYAVAQAPLAGGDLVLLFTDGLYEVDGAGHDEYG